MGQGRSLCVSPECPVQGARVCFGVNRRSLCGPGMEWHGSEQSPGPEGRARVPEPGPLISSANAFAARGSSCPECGSEEPRPMTVRTPGTTARAHPPSGQDVQRRLVGGLVLVSGGTRTPTTE